MEAVTDFIFLGSKITVDGDCSLEIKTPAPGKERYDKPRQHIKKEYTTLLTKVCIVKAMVFSVVMYSWVIRRLSTKKLMLSNCGAGEGS